MRNEGNSWFTPPRRKKESEAILISCDARSLRNNHCTRVKISHAVTGLLQNRIGKITVLFNHVATYCYSLANRQRFFAYVRTCKTRLETSNQVHGCCNIVVQSCYFIIPWQHVLSCMNMQAVDLSWWFQQRCSSLFVHQAMNNLFQHAWTDEQACQQPCSSCPAQPGSSPSTGKNKLCVFTCVSHRTTCF